MSVISTSTAQDFSNLLSSIVDRIRWAKLDVNYYSESVPVDPSAWVVGVDTYLGMEVDGTNYSGFAVVAVYKLMLTLSIPYNSYPSYLMLMSANYATLLEFRVDVLPYQSSVGSFVIPPGSLRLALYVAQPYWPSRVVAYF